VRLSKDIAWVKSSSLIDKVRLTSLKLWVKDVFKLTKNLKNIFPDWNLELLHHGVMFIDETEKKLLGENNGFNDVKGRVVLHKNKNTPLVLGRVIVPNSTHQEISDDFNELGSLSIGDNLLFRDKTTVRSAFSYALVSKYNPIISEWIDVNLISEEVILARASIFLIKGSYPLLVSEFFLCDLPDPSLILG
jgi:chorismate-pyruvate lyase